MKLENVRVGIVCCFALVVTGCRSPSSHTGEAHSAIIGGNITYLRPEVGNYLQLDAYGGVLESCTGTMIDNRHLLTTARCTHYEALHRGGQFTLSRYDGSGAATTQYLDVERTISLITASPQSGGDGDLAVARLANPLPMGLITPATIATAFPATPLTLTIMGYGCIDRTTYDGDGKRYREYSYNGQGMGIGCLGDEGGPIFAGGLLENGPIVQVYSGFYEEDTGFDYGADPIPYREHIYALAEAMDHDGICYRAHVQNVGWMPAVCDGAVAGTTGQSLRLEAVQIWSARPGVKICYQASVQNSGWQAEVCDGDMAGTVGQSLQIEAIRIRNANPGPRVHYKAHVQNTGWQSEVSDDAIAGTIGQRMEALTVSLAECVPQTSCGGLCGNASDGCGGTIVCPPCCVPKTTCPINVCGMVDDGCGGFINCGVAHCEGKRCGASDGCGGQCDGTCPGTEICSLDDGGNRLCKNPQQCNCGGVYPHCISCQQ
jgi:hypothetical protein